MSIYKKTKKINKDLLQKNRAWLITTDIVDQLNFDEIPIGSALVDTNNGDIYYKLEKYETWILKEKNQNSTICIMKNQLIIEEFLTIKSIDEKNKTFIYTMSNEQQRYGYLTKEGYCIFNLYDNSYIGTVADIKILVDGVLQYSYNDFLHYPNEEIIYDDESICFYLSQKLVQGQRLNVIITISNRIGNPEPRVFIDKKEPDVAQKGDLWINYNGDIDKSIEFNKLPEGIGVFWDDIKNKPTTLEQYGIKDAKNKNDDIYLKDILEFPEVPKYNMSLKVILAKGGNAGSVKGLIPGQSANSLLQLDSKGELPENIINQIKKEMKKFVETLSMPIQKNIIISWYGSSDNVPEGWHICDGTKGTPDLRDKFIIGVGNKFKEKETGGSFLAPSLNEDYIFKHKHNFSYENTTSVVGKSTKKRIVFQDVDKLADYYTDIYLKDTSSELESIDTEFTPENYQRINVTNPYVALFRIMKIN